MISKDYVGYMEGMDISKIPQDFLAYPSKNVIVHKGVAYSRPGIKNDGNAPTGNNKVNGEFVWKDALSGELAIRTTIDGRFQVKLNGLWITLYSGLTADAAHTRWATWTDSNGDIIKNRLFGVDGTDAIYEFNGGVGTVQSVDSGAHTITLTGTDTIEQLGFDPGNVTPQAIRVVRFVGGVIVGIDDYTNTDDGTTGVFQLSAAFAHTINPGDLVIAAVVKHTDVLTGINKDDVYNYKNRLTIGTLSGLRVFFSNVEAKLDYTVPSVSDRTAISPFFVDLPSNYTAMIGRYNQSSDETILWISDIEGWTKVTALIDQDSFGNWVSTNRFDDTERLGALPFAVADFKGDSVYLAQDLTLQRITTIDVLSKDSILLLSDEIEGTLSRLNPENVRIYYLTRYIYIVFPLESTLIMLDTIETHGEADPLYGCQAPQTLPLSCMSVIDGVLSGHSNVRDETFAMFVGRNDLGAAIESVFAFGYYQGYQRASRTTHVTQDFFLKSATKIGVSCRMTQTSIASVETDMENDGFKGQFPYKIDGSKVKSYDVSDDEGWATHLWGSASIGGGDDPANPIKRVYAWSTFPAIGWFEFRPIFTISGPEQEFHLLGWYIDDTVDVNKIPPDLFIERD